MSKQLGDIKFPPSDFDNIDSIFKKAFTGKSFEEANSQRRFDIVCETLLELIQNTANEAYLISALIKYFRKISSDGILEAKFNQTGFEYWLNNHSNLSYEDNRKIRGKITGRYIPRDDFQHVFPVGQGRVYAGSHTVTAHNPPDLDTMTASFWTWMDAFACRVGSSLTVWNLPNGKPGPTISALFEDFFGEEVFFRIAKHKTVITHVALDILTQDRFVKASADRSINEFHRRRYLNAIVLVDEDGYYLGDWRPGDADMVGQVQRLLNRCFYLYEEEVIKTLTQVFAEATIKKNKCQQAIESLFERSLLDLPALALSAEDIKQLDAYLKNVLNVPEGQNASIGTFLIRMDELANSNFAEFKNNLGDFLDDDNYDNDNQLELNRQELFDTFNKTYHSLSNCVRASRQYLDRLDIAMAIKQKVLGHIPQYATQRAEVDEIRRLMTNYRHVTIAFEGKDKRLTPLGVIHREDLDQHTQGTASVRDFCNPHEIKIADHIEVISAIDHHRSQTNSKSVMTLNVADVQSSNTLMAEEAFRMNDRYSTRGQDEASILSQLKALQTQDSSAESLRLIEKLIRKQQALLNQQNEFYVHPVRETQEYLSYLNAIIDDTDLLAKVSWRDLTIIVELLNRLKSLQNKKEVEILTVNDLPRNRKSLKKATARILQDEDMYSFYANIYTRREQHVTSAIQSVQSESIDTSGVFEDRKVQNAYNIVSQFKLFPNSWMVFQSNRNAILEKWLEITNDVRAHNVTNDLFVHMNSTVPGAEEAYKQSSTTQSFQDEIWVSIDPYREEAVSHLRQFLSQFRNHPKHNNINLHYTIEGAENSQTQSMLDILDDFIPQGIACREINDSLIYPVIVIKFNAGELNSRKSDITPYLPKLNN